jgi:hypothetical protein
MRELRDDPQCAREEFESHGAGAQPPLSVRLTFDPAEDPAAPFVATAAPTESVAILPFVDMSPERDQEYFCDGIAEEIINALCCMRNLRVASRTSSFQFKGHAADIREIGRALGVGSVLEGSVEVEQLQDGEPTGKPAAKDGLARMSRAREPPPSSLRQILRQHRPETMPVRLSVRQTQTQL